MRKNHWLGVMALALTLSGCGKEEAPAPPAPPDALKQTLAAKPPDKTSAPAATVTLTDLDAVTKAAKPYKIALIIKTRNNPFFLPMIAEFEKTAKEMGVTFEVQSPAQENDKEQQFALVQSVASKGVDAILVTPADSKGIVPALLAAQKTHALIINLDNRVDGATAKAQGVTLDGYIGTDNEAGGKQAGEAMLEALGGKGQVAILEGIRGVDNAEARKNGFTATVQGKLEIVASETAEWDMNKAYQKMGNILAAHPDITGVFCANDKMALGAMKAIAEANKKGKITVVGFDAIPDVQPALDSGEMAATIRQRADLMGKYGVKMAVGILDGKIKKGGDISLPLDTVKKK